MKLILSVLQRALVLAASSVVPRTNEVWAVGGNRGLRYADNSMHFFEYCRRHLQKKVVWLSASAQVIDKVRAAGHEAYPIWNLRGIWYALRAKWHVYDVAPPADTGPFHRGALLLNLWHGIPLKDITCLHPNPTGVPMGWRARIGAFVDRGGAIDYFCHPNRRHVDHILRSFDIRPENVIFANLPRNIVFDPNAAATTTYIQDEGDGCLRRIRSLHAAGHRIVGYFPTWRSDGSDLFLGALSTEAIEEVNAALRACDAYLITKWHTCSYAAYGHAGKSNSAETLLEVLARQSNFIVLDFQSDLNSYLPNCDLLVTDYSSVLFDFLLADKPQLFLPYDLEAYSRDWGFLFDYAETMPGPIVRDIPALLRELGEFFQSPVEYGAAYSAKRAALRAAVFEELQGMPRLIDAMERAGGPRARATTEAPTMRGSA
jgi:CDP-glycerol glycerophosphotransferase